MREREKNNTLYMFTKAIVIIENCRLRTATARFCSVIHSNLNRFVAAEDFLHYRSIYKYNYRMRQPAIKTDIY